MAAGLLCFCFDGSCSLFSFFFLQCGAEHCIELSLRLTSSLQPLCYSLQSFFFLSLLGIEANQDQPLITLTAAGGRYPAAVGRGRQAIIKMKYGKYDKKHHAPLSLFFRHI